MDKTTDAYVFFLIIIIIIIWGFIVFRRWLFKPRKAKLPFIDDVNRPTGQAVQLLEQWEYKVLHGKYRVPITMKVDQKVLQSRYFIDYFAQKDDKVFVVKLARERQFIQMTGSSIRDRLLPYFLLFDEISGVLYVDVNRNTVKEITFHLDDE